MQKLVKNVNALNCQNYKHYPGQTSGRSKRKMQVEPEVNCIFEIKTVI